MVQAAGRYHQLDQIVHPDSRPTPPFRLHQSAHLYGCPRHLSERFTSTVGQRPGAIHTLQLDNYAKELPLAERLVGAPPQSFPGMITGTEKSKAVGTSGARDTQTTPLPSSCWICPGLH